MTEPNGELDKLIDASTHRIGNEPGESNSLAESEEQHPDPEEKEG